jgi:hypothetical protein
MEYQIKEIQDKEFDCVHGIRKMLQKYKVAMGRPYTHQE